MRVSPPSSTSTSSTSSSTSSTSSSSSTTGVVHSECDASFGPVQCIMVSGPGLDECLDPVIDCVSSECFAPGDCVWDFAFGDVLCVNDEDCPVTSTSTSSSTSSTSTSSTSSSTSSTSSSSSTTGVVCVFSTSWSEVELNPTVLLGGLNFDVIVGQGQECSGSAIIADYKGCVNFDASWSCTGDGPVWPCVDVEVPLVPGVYGYYGCVDLNDDLDYGDAGEQSAMEFVRSMSCEELCNAYCGYSQTVVGECFDPAADCAVYQRSVGNVGCPMPGDDAALTWCCCGSCDDYWDQGLPQMC